jgi:hypothetical protein
MLSEKSKIESLIGELLHYALQSEPRKVVIAIEDLGDRIAITMEDDGAPRGESERRKAERYLNAPHRNELSEYYSGLVGEETCAPCNLRMVGMIVDGGKVDQGEPGTRLSVWWKHK